MQKPVTCRPTAFRSSLAGLGVRRQKGLQVALWLFTGAALRALGRTALQLELGELHLSEKELEKRLPGTSGWFAAACSSCCTRVMLFPGPNFFLRDQLRSLGPSSGAPKHAAKALETPFLNGLQPRLIFLEPRNTVLKHIFRKRPFKSILQRRF